MTRRSENVSRRSSVACGSIPSPFQSSQMQVSVRTRPLSSQEQARGERSVVHSFCQDNVVRIIKEGRQGAVLRSEMGSQYEYQFDRVFGHETGQQQVYEETTKELVAETLGGKNCTVFAYGATGAGKTHTMMGTEEDPGIMPRALIDIFKGIHALEEEFLRSRVGKVEREWKVKLSYLEVYNETIYDLLTDKQKPLQPCEDPTDFRVKVLGLTEMVVEDVSQVLELLKEGNGRRRMESTAANQVSSRSHAVIQVNVECVHLEWPSSPAKTERKRLAHKPKKTVTSSTLSLIDLAGSERAAATQNRGARLREGANINKSLLALANCINALSSKKASRVKYRDSKLTHLLKSSLEGNCRLSMIAAINPSHKCYEESHNTLKYANRAKDIKVKATAQSNRRTIVESEEEIRMDELVAENQELRERLSRLSSISGSGGDVSRSFLGNSSGFEAAISEGEDEDMQDAHSSSFKSRVRKKIDSMSISADQPVSLEAWKSPTLDAKQHQVRDAFSPKESDLIAKLTVLQAQNKTLAQLAANQLKVESRQLMNVVHKAASLAINDQNDKIQSLQELIESQKKEIEQLRKSKDELLHQREFASGTASSSSTTTARSKARRSSIATFATHKENQEGTNSPVASTAATVKRQKGRRESFIPKPSKSKKRLSSEGLEGPARIKQKIEHISGSSSPLPHGSIPPPPPDDGDVDMMSTSSGKGCLMYPRLRLRKPR